MHHAPVQQDPSSVGHFSFPTPLGGNFLPNIFPPISPHRTITKISLVLRLVKFPSAEVLWSDIKTMRWMRVPASSFQILLYPTIFYLNYRLFQNFNLIPRHWLNPFEPFLLISYALPDSSLDGPRYSKGYLDLAFIAYYIVFWSFVRQSVILYIFRPMAQRWGIQNPAKLDRFAERGYAATYVTFMAAIGLYIMYKSPVWWYKTEYFWRGYPHWQMTPFMKTYYLLQMAYWSHQLLVLILQLENPGKDFAEIMAHHLITLWLIGWSYLINLTVIGNAVFISMDVSEASLGLAKICNYLQLEKPKCMVFMLLLAIWTYFRHWLNLVMLWSVWTEYDLIPEHAKVFNPREGVWLPYWMKYQVFAPLVALQLVNLFWYFLIWRILVRAIISSKLDDEVPDDEGDTKSSRPDGTMTLKNLCNSSETSK